MVLTVPLPPSPSRLDWSHVYSKTNWGAAIDAPDDGHEVKIVKAMHEWQTDLKNLANQISELNIKRGRDKAQVSVVQLLKPIQDYHRGSGYGLRPMLCVCVCVCVSPHLANYLLAVCSRATRTHITELFQPRVSRLQYCHLKTGCILKTELFLLQNLHDYQMGYHGNRTILKK